jgi:hypothetical protein
VQSATPGFNLKLARGRLGSASALPTTVQVQVAAGDKPPHHWHGPPESPSNRLCVIVGPGRSMKGLGHPVPVRRVASAGGLDAESYVNMFSLRVHPIIRHGLQVFLFAPKWAGPGTRSGSESGSGCIS